MTNSKVLPKTYATLRFAGDGLDPEHISAILPVKPKRAHRKGQAFSAGPRASNLTGRTGIWYFDTREMQSHDLADHLRAIVTLLYPEPGNTDRVTRLREVMGTRACRGACQLLLVRQAWRRSRRGSGRHPRSAGATPGGCRHRLRHRSTRRVIRARMCRPVRDREKPRE